MATPKREWYEGAIYHITARGNHGNNIFNNKNDFKKYLSILEESLIYYEEYTYEIVAYCLMTNHVHIMLKTDKTPPGLLISRVHSIYTRYFNKKYNYTGHLFQERYFSGIVHHDVQMLEISKYIHLNPVKAKIVEFPEKYKWSSYSILIGKVEETLINSDIILSYFNDEMKFERYKEFVEMQ